MKLSWTSLKISIAGAKLSHLVQKDRIWDHGSMTEQARIIFYLVQKAKNNGNIESLKKYMTISCFEKLQKRFYELEKHDTNWQKENSVITELAVISVHTRKDNKPDMFTALIKGYNRKTGDERYDIEDRSNKFSAVWSFIRQGEWWVLDDINIGRRLF
jgi:predicted lipid-binding transport protein (Tim44 family)